MSVRVSIGPARVREAEQILRLQYLCFQEEAARYGDDQLPPLTQTLPALLAEYDTHTILVTRLGGEVVGSVRGQVVGTTCRIGRLMVHPRLRRQGLGTRLLQAMEDAVPGVERFELFTGDRSGTNLRLYHRLGYRAVRTETVAPRVRVVYLQKGRDADR